MNARHTSVATRAATVTTAKTTMTLRRRGALGVAGAAVFAAASLGVTATAFAKKGVDDNGKDARTSVACGTGSLKLKASNESGNRIELEAEVDSNTPGQDWTVTLADNGKAVWTGKRTTVGPSGSFSVETTVDAEVSATTPTDPPTSSTSTTASTDTASPSTTTTTASPDTSDDSSSTAGASPTGDDKGGSSIVSDDKAGDDKGGDSTVSDDKAGDDKGGDSTVSDDKPGDDKGGDSTVSDDKPGDDKGGDSRPGSGNRLIGVTATFDTLTCATELTM